MRGRAENSVTELAYNNLTSEAVNIFGTTATSPTEKRDEALRTGPYWYRYMPELHIPEHWQQFPPRSNTEHEILGFAILFLALLSFCGNGCVMYVFMRTKSLRTPSNALIVNLALSDFLMMLTQKPLECPIYITNSFHHRWVLPAFWCPFMAFTGGVFGIASIMSMTVVAIDRYFVICRPFSMLRSRMSPHRARLAIGFVWLYSLFWSMPPLFGFSRYVPEGFMTTCSFDYLDDSFTSRSVIFAMAVGAYFAPLTAVIACYTRIIMKARKSERRFSHSSVESAMHKERESRKQETHIAKVILLVIICWAASWTPYLVVSFMGIFFWRDALTPWTSQAPALFAKTGSVYNPFVYAISHPKYREAVRRHFPLLVCFPAKADDTDETSESESDKSDLASAQLVAAASANDAPSSNYTSVGVAVEPCNAVVRLTHGNVSDIENGARTEYEEIELQDSRYGPPPPVTMVSSVDAASMDGNEQQQHQRVASMTKASSPLRAKNVVRHRLEKSISKIFKQKAKDIELTGINLARSQSCTA